MGFKISGGGRNGIKSSGLAKVIANHVTGIATDGVEFTSEAAAGLVERNVIEDNLDDGIDVNFSQLVVSNNVVRGNRGDGVEYRLRNRPSAVGTVVFRANDVSANRHDGIQIIDQDTTAPTATKVVLDRNVVATNGQAAIGLLDAAESNEDYRAASLLERMVVTNNTVVANAYGITGGDNMTVANNVFANNTNTALKRVDGASLATYNLFWANGLASDGSNLDGAHNVNANPLLDSTYHLQSGSPAIDAGIAALTLANGEVVVDIPPAQYNGSAPDLGRYETGGTAANAAPVVSAGPDQSIVFPATATLTGSVSDDGRPNPPGTTTKQWTQVAGPPGVTFGSPGSTTTTATFPAAGVYTLRLTANDSALTSSDDVVITVVSGGGSGGTVDARVAAGPDDAEEAASGSVALGSSRPPARVRRVEPDRGSPVHRRRRPAGSNCDPCLRPVPGRRSQQRSDRTDDPRSSCRQRPEIRVTQRQHQCTTKNGRSNQLESTSLVERRSGRNRPADERPNPDRLGDRHAARLVLRKRAGAHHHRHRSPNGRSVQRRSGGRAPAPR